MARPARLLSAHAIHLIICCELLSILASYQALKNSHQARLLLGIMGAYWIQ